MRIKRLSIVVPVYNEQATIQTILDRLDQLDLPQIEKEIIVVDDGSTDQTKAIVKRYAQRASYKVITHQRNQGKGAALRTGFAKATGDAIVVQDADLEYDPKDIRKLVHFMEQENAMVVYGSRMLNKKRINHGGYFFFYGGRFINHLTNFLYRAKLTDEATGYKLFDAPLLKSIQLVCKRFEFCPEVTAKIAKRHIKIHEIEISYHARTKAQGKKIRFRDGFEAIVTLVRYRF